MASIQDVARKAGVSTITASRVVRNLPNVRPATRERVQRAVAELNYVPNAVARSLKQARSGLVALIVTDMTDPHFSAVARGVEDAVRAMGLILVIGNSDDELGLEAEYLRVMNEHRVDGIILVPTPRPEGQPIPTLPKPTPLVLVDRSLPGVAADVVRCNTRSGTRLLCQHLIALGHRRIAIVGGLPRTPTWDERVSGYRSAMRALELPGVEEVVLPGNYKAESGAAAVRELMSWTDQPEAIIAANSKVARGVLDELVSLGVRVPEDIAVSAIDDPMPSSAFWPRLTVVKQPGYEMGKAAVELLRSRIRPASFDGPPREIVFDAVFQIGVTCGEPS